MTTFRELGVGDYFYFYEDDRLYRKEILSTSFDDEGDYMLTMCFRFGPTTMAHETIILNHVHLDKAHTTFGDTQLFSDLEIANQYAKEQANK